MKQKLLRFVPFLILGIIWVTSLSIYYEENIRISYTPIYMTRTDLEKSIRFLPEGAEIKQPGKIYYKAPYLYINEKYKGVHVINNSDPYFPKKEGFITAPGCLDIAIKGDIMYLDNSVDLVAFNLMTKQESKRIKEVMPEPISPDNQRSFHNPKNNDNMIVVGWKLEEPR